MKHHVLFPDRVLANTDRCLLEMSPAGSPRRNPRCQGCGSLYVLCWERSAC